jgi:hypothetical protein
MNTNEHQQPSRTAIPCLVEVRAEDGAYHRICGLYSSTFDALDAMLEKFGAWASITVSPLGGTSK